MLAGVLVGPVQVINDVEKSTTPFF